MAIYNSLMATLHHLAAFTVAATLFYEFIAFHKNITLEEMRSIQKVDLWYGISAGVVLAAGLLRVFFFEKGPNFYVISPLFWVKMVLFAVVGILSIVPTMRFIKWGRAYETEKILQIPEDEFKRVRLFIRLELIGIALILFAAPAMARGILVN